MPPAAYGRRYYGPNLITGTVVTCRQWSLNLSSKNLSILPTTALFNTQHTHTEGGCAKKNAGQSSGQSSEQSSKTGPALCSELSPELRPAFFRAGHTNSTVLHIRLTI